MATINEQFIQVKTKANFETRLEAGEIKNTSIAFIEDTDQIWTQGKYYSVVPKDGKSKQILVWDEAGKAKWDDLANTFTGMEELLAYGIQWDITVSDPVCTRIGNMSLHKSLPIQSQLKGCIAQCTKIIYWLNESDWRFKKDPTILTDQTLIITDEVYTLVNDVFTTLQYENQYVKINDIVCQVTALDTTTGTATLTPESDIEAGTYDVELGAVLNGYDGTVRVYVPSFYIKSEVDDPTRKVWLSTVKVDDTWTHQPEILIDAYRCTVLTSVPENMGYLSTLSANSAISVVNTNSYCRGGSNRSAYDTYLSTDVFRTDLGKPRTNISRATMRTYCTNAGNYMMSYEDYKNIFYWLYVVEYANFNCQATYNETLTDDGYHQGGLGNGVTTINGIYWSYYNGYYPLTPCGYGNALGNGTGIVSMTVVTPTTSGGDPTQSYTFGMPRWRGFDNPFGDIYTNLDGVIIDADNHGDNMDYVYTCSDHSKFADSITSDYEKTGESVHTNGYVKLFNLGDSADIFAYSIGGDATKYKCDYHWVGSHNTTLRTLLVGGGAHDGSPAGLGYLHSSSGVSYAWAYLGFRSVSSFVSVA